MSLFGFEHREIVFLVANEDFDFRFLLIWAAAVENGFDGENGAFFFRCLVGDQLLDFGGGRKPRASMGKGETAAAGANQRSLIIFEGYPEYGLVVYEWALAIWSAGVYSFRRHEPGRHGDLATRDVRRRRPKKS